MKTVEQRDAEKRELRAKVKKWPARLRKLKNRKENPLSEGEFCDKYGFPIPGFNRSKNLRHEPRAAKVAAVEKALEAEGV